MREARNSRRCQRVYARKTTKVCLARGSHHDALALVQYLLDHGGKSNLTHGQLTEALGWEQRIGNTRVLDTGRFERARNHVKDGLDKDNITPCTGYRLHYRPSTAENMWMLVDPAGDLDHHREVVRRELRGDLQQEVAARSIVGRRVETANAAAEMCLKASPPDGVGHRLLLTYALELERWGAVSNTTLAELMVWSEPTATNSR